MPWKWPWKHLHPQQISKHIERPLWTREPAGLVLSKAEGLGREILPVVLTYTA
jgi:hypothetical protein